MNKPFVLIFLALFILGSLFATPMLLADDNDSDSDNSGSGNANDEVSVDASVSIDSDDDDEDNDSDDNDSEDSDSDNSGSGNAEDRRVRFESRERVRIHISGTDEAELRAAIQARNRIHVNGTDLPEDCERTGAVIRCELEERLRTKIEVEADFDLSNEAKALIQELSESLANYDGEVEIEVKAEKEDDGVETEVEVEGTLNAEQQVLLSDLESSLQSLLESLDREVEVKIKIEHELRTARVMVVEAGNSGNTIVKFGDSEVRTRVQLYHHNGEVYGNFGDNETRLINILPDELQERIRERMKLRLELKNDTVEINQEGEYEFEADKEARFLGVFKVKERTRFHVNPETGEILNVNAPWWGFLANDAELEAEQESETDGSVSNTQPVLGEEGEGVEEMIVNETNETA